MAMVHSGHRYDQLSVQARKTNAPRWDRLAILAALVTFWVTLIYAAYRLIG